MVERQYFMGIDNGTQSTKTLIIDGETGQVVGKASKGYGLIAVSYTHLTLPTN